MTHTHMGDYELVSHQETPECSLRLLNLTGNRFVQPHHHHRTTQIYFVLEGTARATVDGKPLTVKKHQILRIPPDTLHSIQTDTEALVLSISVPPLDLSDQHIPT